MEPYELVEQREAAWDRFVEDLPICGCCGHSVYPHDKFYELKVMGNRVIVCANCKSDMDMSETILEDN